MGSQWISWLTYLLWTSWIRSRQDSFEQILTLVLNNWRRSDLTTGKHVFWSLTPTTISYERTKKGRKDFFGKSVQTNHPEQSSHPSSQNEVIQLLLWQRLEHGWAHSRSPNEFQYLIHYQTWSQLKHFMVQELWQKWRKIWKCKLSCRSHIKIEWSPAPQSWNQSSLQRLNFGSHIKDSWQRHWQQTIDPQSTLC